MVSVEHGFIPIEEKHGDSCTCRSMGHVHVELVAASRACPGDRNPHRAGSIAAQLDDFEPPYYPGRGIVITWPAPTSNGVPLMTTLMQVHDSETGEPLLAITGLRMVLGGDNWDGGPLTVDLKMYVDADGRPLIGSPANVVPDPNDPERMYSRVFRCYVTEMRIRETNAEKDAREQWEKLEQLGVKAGRMFQPDPGAVLTFTVPDNWVPGQHAEFQEFMTAWFPDNRVVVYPESAALDITSAD